MRVLTNKQIDEVLKRMTANQIIINDLFEKGIIDVETWNCSADNTTEMSEIVGGCNGCIKVMSTLKRRAERGEQK